MRQIKTRVTELEKFSQCGRYYKYHEQPSTSKPFMIGNIVHYAHQDIGFAKRLLNNTMLSFDDKRMVEEIINGPVVETRKKYPGGMFEYEFNHKVVIEELFEEVELSISGHPDQVLCIDDKRYINDFKVPKSAWKQDYIDSVKQNLLYSYFIMEDLNIEEITFTYILYPKKSFKEAIEHQYTYTRYDVKPQAMKLFTNFVRSHMLDEWKEKKGGQCGWCSMGIGYNGDRSCPLYAK